MKEHIISELNTNFPYKLVVSRALRVPYALVRYFTHTRSLVRYAEGMDTRRDMLWQALDMLAAGGAGRYIYSSDYVRFITKGTG